MAPPPSSPAPPARADGRRQRLRLRQRQPQDQEGHRRRPAHGHHHRDVARRRPRQLDEPGDNRHKSTPPAHGRRRLRRRRRHDQRQHVATSSPAAATAFPPLDPTTFPSVAGIATDGSALYIAGSGYLWKLTTTATLSLAAGIGVFADFPPDSSYDPAASHSADTVDLDTAQGEAEQRLALLPQLPRRRRLLPRPRRRHRRLRREDYLPVVGRVAAER